MILSNRYQQKGITIYVRLAPPFISRPRSWLTALLERRSPTRSPTSARSCATAARTKPSLPASSPTSSCPCRSSPLGPPISTLAHVLWLCVGTRPSSASGSLRPSQSPRRGSALASRTAARTRSCRWSASSSGALLIVPCLSSPSLTPSFLQSLGDRHCENTLYYNNSGDTVHVDLNCLFERVSLPPSPSLALQSRISDFLSSRAARSTCPSGSPSASRRTSSMVSA